MLSIYVGSSFCSGSPLSCFHRRPGKSSIISANSPVGFFLCSLVTYSRWHHYISLLLGDWQAALWLFPQKAECLSSRAWSKAVACSLQGPSEKCLVSVFTMIYINLSLNTHIKSALNPVSSLPKSSHWERHCFISGLLPSPWLYPLICITNCSTQAKQCHTVDTHFTRDRSFYLFTKKQMFKHLLKYCDLPPADWIFPSSNITRKTNIYQSRGKLYSEKGVL